MVSLIVDFRLLQSWNDIRWDREKLQVFGLALEGVMLNVEESEHIDIANVHASDNDTVTWWHCREVDDETIIFWEPVTYGYFVDSAPNLILDRHQQLEVSKWQL